VCYGTGAMTQILIPSLRVKWDVQKPRALWKVRDAYIAICYITYITVMTFCKLTKQNNVAIDWVPIAIEIQSMTL